MSRSGAIFLIVGSFAFRAVALADPQAPEGQLADTKPAPPLSKLDQLRTVRRLTKALDAADASQRLQAIQELRKLTRRVDRTGGQRQQYGTAFEPQIAGLVPLLLKAVTDKSDQNRTTALYSLADSQDPAAVAALRERLQDDSERVRFIAACLLTEFQDASGLPELKTALRRMQKQPRLRVASGAGSPFDDEMLLASLERITGKSFGKIPLNPVLVSVVRPGKKSSAERYQELLDAWVAWWDWTPPQK